MATVEPAPDIVCLQEVERNQVKRRNVGPSPLHADDQVGMIAAALGWDVQHSAFTPKKLMVLP